MMFFAERPVRFITLVICMAISASAVAAGVDLQPQALEFANIYTIADAELAGSSVTIGSVARSITYINGQPQNDYRVATNHKCFQSGQIRFYDDDWLEPGVSNHSTAIASILIGHDPNATLPGVGAFTYQGILPRGRLDVFEFWHFVTEYVFFQKSPNVDVLTMSLGSAFEDWWTRGIELMAQNFGLLVVAGIGNGKDAFDPPLYPAAGANVLGVGVIDSNSLEQFTLADANHSSVGPTDDGRCKPDIVAPGNCLAAAIGEPNMYEATGDYSSYAAPIVAGAAGLLIDKAKSEPNLFDAISPTGGNCVLKSILMTSATKLPGWHKGTADIADDNEHPLDFKQGAGLLNAEAALDLLTSEQWDNNSLAADANEQRSYQIETSGSQNKMLTATLIWNRMYSNKYPFNRLDGENVDLRLELWATDMNEPNGPVLVDYSDSSTDNVEHIYYQIDDKLGDYELVVTTAEGSQSEKPSRYAISWRFAEND